MGRMLKRVPQVPWGSLRDSTGSARDIPPLLSGVAWGDEEAASEFSMLSLDGSVLLGATTGRGIFPRRVGLYAEYRLTGG